MDKLTYRNYFEMKAGDLPVELTESSDGVAVSSQNLGSDSQLQPDQEEQSSGLYVEGYAIIFNTPAFLVEKDGVDYYEQIDSGALNGADMSDVIFNYDHSGLPVARTHNNTLELTVDDKGLFVRARLDGTEKGRELYNAIKGGYVYQMSFSYTVIKEKERYDNINKLFTTFGIKKLYDVSAVGIPVYEDAYINARSADLSGSIVEREAIILAEEAELLKERISLKAKI